MGSVRHGSRCPERKRTQHEATERLSRSKSCRLQRHKIRTLQNVHDSKCESSDSGVSCKPMIPSSSLTAEEIEAYWKKAQTALSIWEQVKSSTSAPEFSTYRETVSDARHGISTILEELEGQHSDLKRKIGAVKLLLKDLERHDSMAKDRFWQAKRP